MEVKVSQSSLVQPSVLHLQPEHAKPKFKRKFEHVRPKEPSWSHVKPSYSGGHLELWVAADLVDDFESGRVYNVKPLPSARTQSLPMDWSLVAVQQFSIYGVLG